MYGYERHPVCGGRVYLKADFGPSETVADCDDEKMAELIARLLNAHASYASKVTGRPAKMAA